MPAKASPTVKFSLALLLGLTCLSMGATRPEHGLVDWRGAVALVLLGGLIGIAACLYAAWVMLGPPIAVSYAAGAAFMAAAGAWFFASRDPSELRVAPAFFAAFAWAFLALGLTLAMVTVNLAVRARRAQATTRVEGT